MQFCRMSSEELKVLAGDLRAPIQGSGLPALGCRPLPNPVSNSGWLDRIAIIMALICGIHCLITPILLVALPILANTFWSSPNFHLWMLGFVLPTTALASIAGYRKHKKKAVAAFAIGGIALLATATFWERASFWDSPQAMALASESQTHAGESCGSCCPTPGQVDDSNSLGLAGINISPPIALNLLGGLSLVVGHWRNFRLRGKHQCHCFT
jgi:hypothetical protein